MNFELKKWYGAKGGSPLEAELNFRPDDGGADYLMVKKKNILAKLWRFFKPINKKTLFPAGGVLYGIICWALMKTIRMKTIGIENEKSLEKQKKNFIYGFWDGRQIMLFPFGIGKNIVTIRSTSDSGEFLHYTHSFFTYTTVRGSSSRGGIRALKGIIRKMRRGKNSAIAVDGPRGPYQKAKMGIIEIAKMTSSAILPLTAAVKKKIILKKYWNKIQIPFPGTSGVYVIGKPIFIPKQSDRQKMNNLLKLFEGELKKITEIADEYC
ncbi:MAG: DUF374 domain-containing protein [Elusimicrobia bacterium]|nr:DUF374 domain-containing protein [Elusimicrobiota bacterium]